MLLDGWFEVLCWKRGVKQCCVGSDLDCGCSTVAPSTATPSTVVPSTDRPRTATPRYCTSLDHRDALCNSMLCDSFWEEGGEAVL